MSLSEIFYQIFRVTGKYYLLGALNAFTIWFFLDATRNETIGMFFFTTMTLLYLKYCELEVFRK